MIKANEAYLRRDKNGQMIPVGLEFTTEKITLSAGSTWENVDVPDGVVEGVLRCDTDTFQVRASGESSDGFLTYETPPLPLMNVEDLELYGDADQEIYAIWTHLKNS